MDIRTSLCIENSQYLSYMVFKSTSYLYMESHYNYFNNIVSNIYDLLTNGV